MKCVLDKTILRYDIDWNQQDLL